MLRLCLRSFLGKEALAKIKADKSPGYPIHQYIPDLVVRNRCLYYILLLANHITAHECPIKEAKEPARMLVERLIEIKTPCLVASVPPYSPFDLLQQADEGKFPGLEIQAIHYGEVKLGSERIGDGYILQDGTAGLSERGIALLLGMDHMSVLKIGKNGLPKKLQSFLEEDEKLEVFRVKVAARCPYQDRVINFYPVSSIELLLRAYSIALIAGSLQKNQQHIGQKCIQVQTTLIHSVLASLICEACGLSPKIQQGMEKGFRKDFFLQERQLLSGALKIQNPGLVVRQNQALLAKSFSFGYEDALTRQEYQALQGKPYPLHQHIEDPKTRNRLSQYLFLLSGQIMVNDLSLPNARKKAKSLISEIETKALAERGSR